MKKKQPFWHRFTLLKSDLVRLQLMLESAEKQGMDINWIEYVVHGEISKDDVECITWGVDATTTKVRTHYSTDDSEITHHYEFKNGDDHILDNDSLARLTQQFNKN
jgi:uncharacterized beta-barrel protein YwiB (DUF1934 family)